MAVSIDELWGLTDAALIGAYAEARRSYAEKKLARDTARARLEWQKARAFVNAAGGVSERRAAVDVSEELARKGQELREMTRDLELLKVDVDVIAIVLRMRGAPPVAALHVEDPGESEADREGG
jgi:hypothetical protein